MSVDVKISDVLTLCDFKAELPWGLSLKPTAFFTLVRKCAADQVFCEVPIDLISSDHALALKPVEFQHAARVAYLMTQDQWDPIFIDVGIPGLCDVQWPVDDGNHRLVAAYLKGKTHIAAELQGHTRTLREIFGPNCLD